MSKIILCLIFKHSFIRVATGKYKICCVPVKIRLCRMCARRNGWEGMSDMS